MIQNDLTNKIHQFLSENLQDIHLTVQNKVTCIDKINKVWFTDSVDKDNLAVSFDIKGKSIILLYDYLGKSNYVDNGVSTILS